MHAYHADTTHFQPNHQSPGATLVNWIRSKLEARRTQLSQTCESGFQRNLEPSAPADRGIDDAAAGGTLPSLARFNPHLIAVNIFAR